MIVGCQVIDCPAIARMVIRDPDGDKLMVCLAHWHDAMDASDGRIRGVRLLDDLDCLQDDCHVPAVAVVQDLDGSPLPACQSHSDDLSWVATPGLLPSDEPGWSRG